jgi:hypothetical protein
MAAPDIFTYITALAITLGLILLLWAGLAFIRARLMNMPLGGSSLLNTPKLKILETRFIDGRYKLCRATDGLRDYTLLLGPTEAEILHVADSIICGTNN